MGICYFELRQKIGATQQPTLAADIAKHLQTRQHLGKTIVICDKPLNLMSVVRKHWLKFARNLQKERASTVNAEKILRLTNAITHMHHMQFVPKPPEEQPNADVFFVEPAHIGIFPINTFSLYIATPTPLEVLKAARERLPSEALIIDYGHSLDTERLELRPKQELREHANEEWRAVVAFLSEHTIDILSLSTQSRHSNDIDDALDILLGNNRRFVQIATSFQHSLELAQPTQHNPIEQRQYDLLALLAHRVQALSPHLLPNHVRQKLHQDDTFFLHDVATEALGFAEALTYIVKQHRLAGRSRLAQALLFLPH